jgi:MOSC domain-containing protein YiiM
MTTLAQADLPRDPGILKTAAQYNGTHIGVYASVIEGGTIRQGDGADIAEH